MLDEDDVGIFEDGPSRFEEGLDVWSLDCC